MGTILTILAVCAVIGAILSKMSGEGAVEGAVGGAFMGGSCMLQAIIAALPVLLGLWLLMQLLS